MATPSTAAVKTEAPEANASAEAPRRRSKRERPEPSAAAVAEEPSPSVKRAAPSPSVKRAAPGAEGPFPTHAHPTTAACYAATNGLAALHPEAVARVQEAKRAMASRKEAAEGGCGSRREVLDALVGTILSQNTTDTNSHRAFASLKAAFPTWEAVRTSPAPPLVEAIRSGGLAEIKVGRIQAILETVHAERGECSLEHLRGEPDAKVKDALRRFKGVGPKTISCVLLFCLGRDDFPVDTHVWKIAVALGWVPKTADRDATYEHLNRRVPDDIKYALHVLLVEHGKRYKNSATLLRKLIAGEPIEEPPEACPLVD